MPKTKIVRELLNKIGTYSLQDAIRENPEFKALLPKIYRPKRIGRGWYGIVDTRTSEFVPDLNFGGNMSFEDKWGAENKADMMNFEEWIKTIEVKED